jgi:hypothetical protein
MQYDIMFNSAEQPQITNPNVAGTMARVMDTWVANEGTLWHSQSHPPCKPAAVATPWVVQLVRGDEMCRVLADGRAYFCEHVAQMPTTQGWHWL